VERLEKEYAERLITEWVNKTSEISEHQFQKIFRNWGDSYSVKLKLAGDPRTPGDILLNLSINQRNSIIEEVLKNPGCTQQIFKYWIGKRTPRFIINMLHNPLLPVETLLEIYYGGFDKVITELAQFHRNFPEDLTGWSLSASEWDDK
jgi:hypothetical protein